MNGNMLTEPPDPTQRRCYDCAHLKGAVSWWCTNQEAVKWRGTAIPDVHDCPFWAPGTYRQRGPSLWERFTVWRAGVNRKPTRLQTTPTEQDT